MRIHAIGLRRMRLRAPFFAVPATAGIGHPTAKSQRAGLDHLMRVAVEQAAARSLDPVADTVPIAAVTNPAVADAAANVAGPGDAGDWTPRAYWHS